MAKSILTIDVQNLDVVKEHIAALEQKLVAERLAVREVSEMLVEGSRAHKARISELETENLVLRSLLPQEEPQTYASTGADIVLNHEKPAGGQNRSDDATD